MEKFQDANCLDKALQTSPPSPEENFVQGKFYDAFLSLFKSYERGSKDAVGSEKRKGQLNNALFNRAIRLVNLFCFYLEGARIFDFKTVMKPIDFGCKGNSSLWEVTTTILGNNETSTYLRENYVLGRIIPENASTIRLGYNGKEELIVVVLDGLGGLSLNRFFDSPGSGYFQYNVKFIPIED